MAGLTLPALAAEAGGLGMHIVGMILYLHVSACGYCIYILVRQMSIVWVWIRRFTEGHGIASHYGYDSLYVQLLKYGQYVCKVIEISVVQSHHNGLFGQVVPFGVFDKILDKHRFVAVIQKVLHIFPKYRRGDDICAGPGLALEYAVVHYCRQRHRFRIRIVNGSSLAAGKQEKRSPQGDKFQLEFHGIRI